MESLTFKTQKRGPKSPQKGVTKAKKSMLHKGRECNNENVTVTNYVTPKVTRETPAAQGLGPYCYIVTLKFFISKIIECIGGIGYIYVRPIHPVYMLYREIVRDVTPAEVAA